MQPSQVLMCGMRAAADHLGPAAAHGRSDSRGGLLPLPCSEEHLQAGSLRIRERQALDTLATYISTAIVKAGANLTRPRSEALGCPYIRFVERGLNGHRFYLDSPAAISEASGSASSSVTDGTS
jgi:hypothetical protein